MIDKMTVWIWVVIGIVSFTCIVTFIQALKTLYDVLCSGGH